MHPLACSVSDVSNSETYKYSFFPRSGDLYADYISVERNRRACFPFSPEEKRGGGIENKDLDFIEL